MDSLHTLFMLMFAAALLFGLAQKIRIPYRLVLIIGGTDMGLLLGLYRT